MYNIAYMYTFEQELQSAVAFYFFIIQYFTKFEFRRFK